MIKSWETDSEAVASIQAGKVGSKVFKGRLERTWQLIGYGGEGDL